MRARWVSTNLVKVSLRSKEGSVASETDSTGATAVSPLGTEGFGKGISNGLTRKAQNRLLNRKQIRGFLQNESKNKWRE